MTGAQHMGSISAEIDFRVGNISVLSTHRKEYLQQAHIVERSLKCMENCVYCAGTLPSGWQSMMSYKTFELSLSDNNLTGVFGLSILYV